TAEYPAGGWWKDTVTVSSVDNGDAVLADGTPGVGVNQATLIKPLTKTANGTLNVSDQVADLLNWKSPTASGTFRVDASAPQFDLHCTDVKLNATGYATFQAKDDQSGLASPPNGTIVEDSSIKGRQTLTAE